MCSQCHVATLTLTQFSQSQLIVRANVMLESQPPRHLTAVLCWQDCDDAELRRAVAAVAAAAATTPAADRAGCLG
jgi:hypothetical protein